MDSRDRWTQPDGDSQPAPNHSAGAHPYFVSPDHTAVARQQLGEEPMLWVEQKVILEADGARARELARPLAQIDLGLPNHRNN